MREATPFRLFNTLKGQVEPVRPLEPGHLRMYGCGPTVYSYAHIGNFRSFLTADLILRTAQALGWKTTYVTNITDVGHLVDDDTIDPSGEDRMARALKSKEGELFSNVWDLARHYTDEFVTDSARLNLLPPDVRPRATEHIREQIRAVEQLLEVGAAYETSDAVYFSVAAFPDYGKLSGNTEATQLRTAVREVVMDDEKRDPRDFALWKKDEGHLMQWHSPWGWGFPGWHLECSVMAQRYLGTEIDLHTGGEDLIFPHHECEIAQAESLTGQPFARHWVHTRFLQVEGSKMSKRLGNFLRVRDVLASSELPQDRLALRLALISGHYRKPFNYTKKTLAASARHVERLMLARQQAEAGLDSPSGDASDFAERLDKVYAAALRAMTDDLNTPAALAAAFGGTKLILKENVQSNGGAAAAAMQFLDAINGLLGIVAPHEDAAARSSVPGTEAAADDELATRVESLLSQRHKARKERDFARADALRDEIVALGVELMDTPDGTEWKRKSRL